MKKTAKKLILMFLVLSLLVSAVPMALMSSAESVEWSFYSGMVASVQVEDGITEITFPAGYTTVKAGFAASSTIPASVRKIIIPDGYTKIDNQAFLNLSNVQEIVVPESITTIGQTAFSNTGIEYFKIPDSVTGSLGTSAFANCKNLVSFDFNNSPGVGGCLAGCTSLQFVYLNVNTTDTMKYLGGSNASNMIGDPEKGMTVVFGDSMTEFPAQLMQFCYIKEIVWTDSAVTLPLNNQNFVKGSVFVDGEIYLDNCVIASSAGQPQFSAIQLKAADGEVNVYIGANCSISDGIAAGNRRNILTGSITGTGTVLNVNFAGEVNSDWTVATAGDGKGYMKAINLTGDNFTVSTNANTAYSYKYNDTNVDPYRAPVEVPTQDGKLYAGKNAEGTPIFVDKDVLTVRAQLPEGASANDETTSIRLLSTVDSLNYSRVGFSVLVVSPPAQNFGINTVYSSIKAIGENVTAADLTNCSESSYIFGLNLINISDYDYETPITVTPYWITKDGMRVEGTARTLTVAELLAAA